MKKLCFIALLFTSHIRTVDASEGDKPALAAQARIEYCGPEVSLDSEHLSWDCANIAAASISDLKSVIEKAESSAEIVGNSSYSYIESNNPHYSVWLFFTHGNYAARFRSIFRGDVYSGVGLTIYCTESAAECIEFQTAMGREVAPPFCSKLSPPSAEGTQLNCRQFVTCDPNTERTPVRVVNEVRPNYPEAEWKNHIAGDVMLDGTVDDKGRLVDLRIYKTSGNDKLDQAALNAVKQWTFEAGKCGDIRIGGSFRAPIRFSAQ